MTPLRYSLLLIALLLLPGFAAAQSAEAGLIHHKSPQSVEATTQQLIATVEEKGLRVIAWVDHAKGASDAGLSLKPTQLVLFGNPKVGTPLMQCSRTVAIDLPQKALIWEDEMGQVWYTYNDPFHLLARHQLGEACRERIGKIGAALEAIAKAATAPVKGAAAATPPDPQR